MSNDGKDIMPGYRPVLVSSSDDRSGASVAAVRLLSSLTRSGVDAHMVVGAKTLQQSNIHGASGNLRTVGHHLRAHIDLLPWRAYRRRKLSPWTVGWFPSRVHRATSRLGAQIVNIHWTGRGFMSLGDLRSFAVPLVWTLHDMWAFTGGCHYSTGCKRYAETCGHCPHLRSRSRVDLSSWSIRKKRRVIAQIHPVIVTPSTWMGDRARESSVLGECRTETIPNGLDLAVYRPISKKVARDLLGIPLRKKVLLFGARDTDDPRKGYEYVRRAMDLLGKRTGKVEYLIVSFGSRPAQTVKWPQGMESLHLGKLSDDTSIVMLYSAVDVFIAPSMEDNLPNTIAESLACGTPVVSFRIGGIPEMVDHKKNGYLAKALDAEDLASGIAWVLRSGSVYRRLSENARTKAVREYDLSLAASRYNDLFRELIERRGEE